MAQKRIDKQREPDSIFKFAEPFKTCSGLSKNEEEKYCNTWNHLGGFSQNLFVTRKQARFVSGHNVSKNIYDSLPLARMQREVEHLQ
jgi:hypothetical protein